MKGYDLDSYRIVRYFDLDQKLIFEGTKLKENGYGANIGEKRVVFIIINSLDQILMLARKKIDENFFCQMKLAR